MNTKSTKKEQMAVLVPRVRPGSRLARRRWMEMHRNVLTTVRDYVCGTEFHADASHFDRDAFLEDLMNWAHLTSDNALVACKETYAGVEQEAEAHLHAIIPLVVHRPQG